MSVRGGITIDGFAELESLFDIIRPHWEDRVHTFGDLSIGQVYVRRAEGIDIDIGGFGDTDSIRYLYQNFITKTCGDQVFSDMPCSIGCRTVNFAWILSGESTTAVRAFTSLGIYNDLTAGESGISMWATDHEIAGWIDMVLDVIIEEFAE